MVVYKDKERGTYFSLLESVSLMARKTSKASWV